MARYPAHQPTEENKIKITALKSFGITDEAIAKHLGMSSDTLVRFYKHELETALDSANAKVASKLFKKAVEDEDLTAIIFWLKTRARWRTDDTQQVNNNEEIKKEILALRAELDKKYKKDY